jgi:tol-pal system protein YbgF
MDQLGYRQLRFAQNIGHRFAALLAISALFASDLATAQQPVPSARPATPAKQSAPSGQKAAPAKAEGAAVTETARSDTAWRQRVEQLEEQLVDMQVVIGTLESLARGGGAGRAPTSLPSATGADNTRVEALEGQVRALQAQVEQMNQQRGQVTAQAPPSRTASATVLPLQPSIGSPGTPPPAGAAPNGFATTVTPDRDPIGQIIGSAPGGQAQSMPQATASDASSKQLYETAYGLLLQQDYAAAESAFEEFLKRYPGDPLAGNAQYWLGETFYVRAQYKPAAAAFLKGYQAYGRSSKAPDSLLKLAMSLDRLGQRDAACSSYSELSVKFPSAPGAVRGRADSERRRLGCA